MSDGEKQRCQEALDTFKRASLKVKRGSDKWIHFVASAMVLGWVLDEPVYRDNCEALLRELESFVGKKTTG